MKLNMFPMVETYVGFVPHALCVSVIAGVAALVVSIPAMEVTLRVPWVESIKAGRLCIIKMLARRPPHVGVTFKGLQPLPGPLLVEEFSIAGQRSGQIFT